MGITKPIDPVVKERLGTAGGKSFFLRPYLIHLNEYSFSSNY